MDRVAAWITQHGRDHGYRPATFGERARAAGAEAYLRNLGQRPLELFDAIGNHCGRHVVPIPPRGS
eukprot:1058206-Lingulodinium_polyedra.AAC.1